MATDRAQDTRVAHTPGPWRVSWLGVIDQAYAVETTANPSQVIARLTRLPRAHADARLIAAGPDLLAALEETVDQLAEAYDDGQGARPTAVSAVIHRARAAIAQAEGRA